MPQWTGVVTSLVLVAVAVAVVARQRLALMRDLLLAAARAVAQLVAVGAVILLIVDHAGTPGSLGWVGLLVLIAGQVAGRRARGLRHARALATAAVAIGTALTLGLLIVCRIVASDPRVVIPVGGMVVAGATQATALTVARLAEQARSARAAIEARLCLGLSAQEAFRPHQRTALRTALTPPIDSTKVVGLIALPGAMTGLLLAGVSPLTAARYQIIVMYMLLAAAAGSALAAVWLGRLVLFDSAHRLRPSPGASRWERLRARTRRRPDRRNPVARRAKERTRTRRRDDGPAKGPGAPGDLPRPRPARVGSPAQGMSTGPKG